MPLSNEPNMGHWTIELVENNGNSLKAKFEVKKYVLPKFEVVLNHKPTVQTTERTMNVSVCARLFITLFINIAK